MVQNTNAGQQIAMLKAELDKAQGAAATNLDGWQRTYAELQRSESDAAAFVQTIQQLRAELEQSRSDMLGMRTRIQALEAELGTLRKQAEASGDPKAVAELQKLSMEHSALKEHSSALQKEIEKLKATVSTAPAAEGTANGSAASPELQAELDKARADASAHLDGWQRTRAEFANFKKRMEASSADVRQFATSGLVTKLFPVQDDFERAIKNMPDALKGDVWIEGVQLIYRKVGLILEAEGVKSLEVKKNDVFDPSIHEAVTHDEAEDVTSGHVIEELQKGYKIGERIVRPTLVRVAK